MTELCEMPGCGHPSENDLEMCLDRGIVSRTVHVCSGCLSAAQYSAGADHLGRLLHELAKDLRRAVREASAGDGP